MIRVGHPSRVGRRRRWLALWLVPLLLGAAAPAQETRQWSATDEEVLEAIDLIVAELLNRRDAQTHWEAGLREPNDGRHDGGQTALVVLSLLYAGKSPQEPMLRESIEWLAEQDLQGVYSRSIRAAVWAQMPPSFLPRLEADAEWLQQAFSREVDGWSYRLEPTTQRLDNSTTQYGALGLWEAAKRGVEIPPEFWRRLEDRFLEQQQENGGWTYGRTGPPRGSMTAAGLTVLYLTRDLLHADDFQELQHDWQGEGALQRGLDWFAQNYQPDTHPGLERYYTYYLYGVERVGLASGLKYFGDKDWFRSGAAALIDFLTAHPRGEPKRIRQNASTVDLAFGLLFLSRGRAPVVVNKLEAGNLAWNNRPRDAAALARFLSDETEQPLNWQVVPIASEVGDWLDAPMLYLASHQALPWDANSPEAQKLRDYMRRGGLLVFATEGGSRRFQKSVEELLTTLMPEADWRELPEAHPLLCSPHALDSPRFEVQGLSNGVREMALLISGRDVPAVLQATYGQTRVQRDLAIYRLFSNLTMYASGMQPLPPRLAAWHEDTRPQRPATWQVRVGIVRHAGRWNPEPLAWPRFADWLRSKRGGEAIFTNVDSTRLPPADEVPLLILQGVEESALSEPEQRALLDYAKAGGTVLIQTIGGRGRFARSLERSLAALLETRAGGLSRHPLITGAGVTGASD
ncbi:MAG: DUF4159 domain-containing protein, partial [Phycisphaerales bacterium JB038]